MSRLCFAAIYTAFILPGLLLTPPAHAVVSYPPSLGNSATIPLSTEGAE